MFNGVLLLELASSERWFFRSTAKSLAIASSLRDPRVSEVSPAERWRQLHSFWGGDIFLFIFINKIKYAIFGGSQYSPPSIDLLSVMGA